jgi:hypothetical protein
MTLKHHHYYREIKDRSMAPNPISRSEVVEDMDQDPTNPLAWLHPVCLAPAPFERAPAIAVRRLLGRARSLILSPHPSGYK